MEVRPLRDEADARELLVAYGRAWRAAYGGLLPESVIDRVEAAVDDPAAVEDAYDDLSGYPEGRVHVAEDRTGTVRGYTLFRWGADETKPTVRDGEAEVKELYVDPDYWGQGVGSALLEAGLDRLPEDVGSVALELLAGNEVGAGFYESHGFAPDGAASVEIAGETYPTVVYRSALL